MDPISLIFFAVILPMAALFSAIFIIRFRRNYRSTLKSYRSDEASYRKSTSSGSNTQAEALESDAPEPRASTVDGE